MKTINRMVLAMTFASLGLGLCEQAKAVAMPINGSIRFGGTAVASGPSPGSPVTIQFSNPLQVDKGFGAYSAVTHGTPATFTNFDFTGDFATAALSAPPITPLWSFVFGGKNFSFDLQTLTTAHVDANSILLGGTGIAHIDGLDDTAASWTLSGAGTSPLTFGLTSITAAAGVPEGGATIGLLAFGLAGIVILRRQLGSV
jgi:hypothetical protein